MLETLTTTQRDAKVLVMRCLRWWSRSLLASAVVCGGAAFGPSAASANSTYFCPPVQASQVLISGNGRCASAQFYYLTRVEAITVNGDGVDHCAVGKQDAGGWGANVIDPGCGTGSAQFTPCVTPRVGYATIVNRSTSAHYFRGVAFYINCNYALLA
jgi:hypothetical protein